MLTETQTKPRELKIAVRAFATPVNQKKKPKHPKGLRKPSKWTVFFDTETTTNEAFTFRVGVYHVYKDGALFEKGIFFERNPKSDKILSGADIALIETYAEKRGFKILSKEEFVDQILYRYGYRYGGSIVGFNLPFDLSRLALMLGSARGETMRGGFTLKLHPNKANPNIRIKHLSARASLISFAAPPNGREGRGSRRRKMKTPPRRGYFVDVKTLAATLTGSSHSLASLAEHLGIKAKLKVDRHGGKITRPYLDYAVRDVEVTAEAYFKLVDEFRGFNLSKIEPHQLYSEASLGKAHLKEMGIKPLSEVQPDVPPVIFGNILSGYFGGRSEVAFRREICCVRYCDFRSMYPTVCTLQGLWRFVIANGFTWRNAKEEAIALLKRADIGALLERDFWRSLPILVKMKAHDDLFPVRAPYNGKTRSIGLNPLTCEQPLWFTLADVIAAKLLSGRASENLRSAEILEAIRFEPMGPQEGLKPIELQGLSDHLMNPYADDLFREVILLRGKVQSKAKKTSDPFLKHQLEAKSQNLKLIANSTSYGIFAEVNVSQEERLQEVLCFGPTGELMTEQTKAIEKPGTFFHPLLATLITGAARLMLAMAERLVLDEGLDWAFCDTDSIAIVKPAGMSESVFHEKVERVRVTLAKLDPYGDGKDLLKLEDANFDPADGKTLIQLYCYAISAKRYVLFTLDEKRQAGHPQSVGPWAWSPSTALRRKECTRASAEAANSLERYRRRPLAA